jgi:hypothetical protein
VVQMRQKCRRALLGGQAVTPKSGVGLVDGSGAVGVAKKTSTTVGDAHVDRPLGVVPCFEGEDDGGDLVRGTWGMTPAEEDTRATLVPMWVAECCRGWRGGTSWAAAGGQWLGFRVNRFARVIRCRTVERERTLG